MFLKVRAILFLCLSLSLSLQRAEAQLPTGDQFTFIRIKWTDNNIRYGYAFSTPAPLWAHDYPAAEENLYVAIKAATTFKISEDYKVLTFADDEIFNYPFIYACEIGYLTLSDAEVKNLREYLLRGGFLMVDDFRDYIGAFEWNTWLREIRKVLPDNPIRPLNEDHPIFHCFFDLKDDIRKPVPYLTKSPEYWGIFDDNDRLMVLINFNTDVGDGWELPHEDGDFSIEAYKLGINYLVYSYTH